jgi:serine/threonine-protein kinase
VAVSGDPRVGTLLAGYQVERLLGRGGMGEVYLAHDLRLNRKVALKVLAADRAEDLAFRERFLAESELAASIDHPNIVPIYEASEVGGSLFIAMRYVEGTDLKHVLREGTPSPEQTIALLAQVAEALDAAHARGLVHRDVKPSNVIVAPGAGPGGGDHAYLADFGLTKRLADQGAVSDDGQLMGTVDYVAPEQIAGEHVDGRADQYSLGCLMYECLTGEPPFARESDVAALYAHLEEPAPTVTEKRPDLPGAIDSVIATALAKSPDERYATCRELVTTARQALGIAETAPSRRLRASVLVALIAIALATAGVAAFLAFTVGGTDAPRDTLVRIDPATNEVVDSVEVGDRASSVTVGDGYVWVTSFEDRSLWRVDPDSGATRPTPIDGTPLDVVVRNGLAVVASGPFEVSVHRINASTGALIEAIPLPGAEGGVTAVAEGAEGIWVGACGWSGNLGRVSEAAVSGGNITALERIEVPSVTPNWLFGYGVDSPTYSDVAVGFGSVWLAGDGPTLRRIDPETGHLAAVVELPFLPKSMAVGAGALWITALVDDSLARVDPLTNEVGMSIPLEPGTDGVAFGDGSVWVVSSFDGTVARIDPATGEIQATIRVGGRPEDVVVGAGGVWVTTHTA